MATVIVLLGLAIILVTTLAIDVLIGRSASFSYLAMERFWQVETVMKKRRA